MMAFNKLLLFSFFIILSACNGEEQPATTIAPVIAPAGPLVIKNRAATDTRPPDFDTALVSQYIRSIFQDSKGNLWFGAIAEGVARYDQKTLRYFSTADGFISTSVFAINEDKTGNLWFGTGEGVYKYEGKTFRHYNERDGLGHLNISRKSILVDKLGGIWVGTHAGIYKYDPSAEAKAGRSFSLFSLLGSVDVAGLMEDRNGNIWVASSGKGVFRYDGKTISNFHEQPGLGENYAGGMAEDPTGNIWFTMKNGVCKFDGKTFTPYTAKDGLGGTEFWGIVIEKSGIIWVTARGSTTRFDPSLPGTDINAVRVFTPENGFTCCVQSMFQDKSGNMWWGTGQGLYRFNGSRFYQVKKTGPWNN